MAKAPVSQVKKRFMTGRRRVTKCAFDINTAVLTPQAIQPNKAHPRGSSLLYQVEIPSTLTALGLTKTLI